MFVNKGWRIIDAIYKNLMLVLMKRPAPNLEGLKGLKMRTFVSPLLIESANSVCVTPVTLVVTEVSPQLQSGGIDGMLPGMPILVTFKHYDDAKYVTDFNFSRIVSINIVNEAWFQSQPEDVQEAIRGAEPKVVAF
ncbi:MAG: TRAP transporter substrate-binding protein DctP, partial [Pseudolabrys sp.]|nr:TRAP transporter substrate-binding protein DctP [Pseudolabrys sp.]